MMMGAESAAARAEAAVAQVAAFGEPLGLGRAAERVRAVTGEAVRAVARAALDHAAAGHAAASAVGPRQGLAAAGAFAASFAA
jgi:predicted Zn-dependent peptidase